MSELREKKKQKAEAYKVHEKEQIRVIVKQFKEIEHELRRIAIMFIDDSGIQHYRMELYQQLDKLRRSAHQLCVANQASGDARRAMEPLLQKIPILKDRYAYLTPGSPFRMQLLYMTDNASHKHVPMDAITKEITNYTRAATKHMNEANLEPYKEGEKVTLEKGPWHGTVDDIDAKTGIITVVYNLRNNVIPFAPNWSEWFKLKYYPNGNVCGWQDNPEL